MKAIPTVIDKCEDCPYVNYTQGQGNVNLVSYYCRKSFKYLDVEIFHHSIPDWCPLPESNINKLLSDIENLKGIIPLGNELNDQDIVCKYIRRNKIIANL